ncbi:hypothetical protein [Bradyrhizobium sp. HKCCYLS20291]|uniref:hypothetical protein n=1 Tax=Bradyrhizobium sp. HKCCYLS20291 TaxID=3420766 RepID=UPI003EBC5BEB
MPVVAHHAKRFMWRMVRGRMLRIGPVVAMAAVSCVAIGEIWLGLASREVVAPPRRGSLPYELLTAFDTAPGAALAMSAVDAALQGPPADNDNPAGSIFRIEHAQQLIARTLAQQPLQPRLWLARTALLERAGADASRSTQAMKMVYFTSSASGSLTAERLRQAVQLRRLDDRELVDLIRADATTALLRSSKMQPAALPSDVSDAYRSGSPAGRALLVGVVADIAPDRLALLR